VVNLLGNPVDYERLKKIIAGRDIVLLEDNCESMGAELNGKKAGTFGVIGTHSTFFSHHMSTMEGGICVTDDEEIYHILLCLRAHGWLRNLPEKNHVFNKSGDAFKDSFCFVLPGYCVRPMEMQGAIGLEQLKKLDRMIELRRANAVAFKKRFGGRDDWDLQVETGRSSWFGFALVINEKAGYSRADLVAKLRAGGVECRPIVTGDFTQNPVIAHMDHRVHGELKNAQYIHTHGIMLGNNPEDLTGCFDVLERACS
jgi:CDP-6-deoxy-D-xylo-4-hexulose-3-dehydrase